MDARGPGASVFVPDMGKDLYDPEVIFTNIARDRGEAAYDVLPERVRKALERAEAAAPPGV